MSLFEDGLLLASLVTNLFCIRALKGRPVSPVRKKAICECSHSAAFHDESGCHDVVKRGQGYNKQGNWVSRLDPCKCVRYVGPDSTYDPGLDQDIARAQKSLGNKK